MEPYRDQAAHGIKTGVKFCDFHVCKFSAWSKWSRDGKDEGFGLYNFHAKEFNFFLRYTPLDHVIAAMRSVQMDKKENLECFESCMRYDDPIVDTVKKDQSFIRMKDIL